MIDQDSIDELTSYSQNTESEYKRSIIICQKIVYRINGFDNVGCLAKDIKGKLEECNFKYSSTTNGLFMREAKRLHKNYMTDMGLRNGYVKNNLSVATLNKLAEELYEIYEGDIKYMVKDGVSDKDTPCKLERSPSERETDYWLNHV